MRINRTKKKKKKEFSFRIQIERFLPQGYFSFHLIIQFNNHLSLDFLLMRILLLTNNHR